MVKRNPLPSLITSRIPSVHPKRFVLSKYLTISTHNKFKGHIFLPKIIFQKKRILAKAKKKPITPKNETFSNI